MKMKIEDISDWFLTKLGISSPRELRVRHFRKEGVSYGTVRHSDPLLGKPDEMGVTISREIVLPSFLERYNSLLDRAPQELREAVFKIDFAPTFTKDSGEHASRETGDSVLTLFETYIGIDPVWIKEVDRAVYDESGWEGHSYTWRPHYYLHLAHSLLEELTVEVAKKYNERSGEVKAAITRNILDRAVAESGVRDVCVTARVFDALSQEDAPANVYDKVGKFMKKIDDEYRERLMADSRGSRATYKRRSERFVESFAREGLDALKQNGIGPEFWVTIADMVAYEVIQLKDVPRIDKGKLSAYLERHQQQPNESNKQNL